MRGIFSLMMVVVLAGCGTVLDPAPYEPGVANFQTLDDASDELAKLAKHYAHRRDQLMREQLAFDIPLLGLAAGTVASGIYGGSKDLTLGLGLGAAAVGGGRIYFGPQARVAAYHAASSSLACAASVALGMKIVGGRYRETAPAMRDRLAATVARADALLVATDTLAADRPNLLAARDQGRTALDALSVAVDTLDSAVANLEIFARTVVNGTTNTVMTGVQKLDAALAVIKATPTTVPTAAATPPVPGKVSLPAAQPTPADVVRDLREQATAAAAVAKQINDAWAKLAKCSSS